MSELEPGWVHTGNSTKMVSEDGVNFTPAEPDVPHIIHKGVYTLWEKPDGTLRIQYRRDDKDEDDFMEIPGGILRMAQMVGEGKMNPLAALKAMRNMNGG